MAIGMLLLEGKAMNGLSNEENALMVVAIMRDRGVKRAILSPGSANMAITRTIQEAGCFEVYSSVDERSAAYMACGLASATGEPVAISCTGATSSLDYLPGLTEAYHRKLPVLALLSMNDARDVGNLTTQVIDRSRLPRDSVRYFASISPIESPKGRAYARLEINRAVSALSRDGGGPAAIEVLTTNEGFGANALPTGLAIGWHSVLNEDEWPVMHGYHRVAVFIGAHAQFESDEVDALDSFAASHDSVVMCDLSSGYRGDRALWTALACAQLPGNPEEECLRPDLIVHLGEESGDYETRDFLTRAVRAGTVVWRVSPDGEVRETFGGLREVFQASPEAFFSHYADAAKDYESLDFAAEWQSYDARVRAAMPELPFSNLWAAQRLSDHLPTGSSLHLAILSSLSSRDFFPVPEGVTCSANTGGFGIDGCVSTALGESLADPERIQFCVVGDLAFFYDMNCLGNRHVSPNFRVMLVNNGLGMTFKLSNNRGFALGPAANEFVAAEGHNIPRFPVAKGSSLEGISPAQAWAESLGFKYLFADSKESFDDAVGEFVSPDSVCPILFECFTHEVDERTARDAISSIDGRLTAKEEAKRVAKKVLPKNVFGGVKRVLGR